MDNKEVLNAANKAVTSSDYEGFLTYCTEDVKWIFVGDETLQGKENVRQWMEKNYINPPIFNVENLIAENDFVTAIGNISLANVKGRMLTYEYCDVWQFREGKMAVLKAFVIEADQRKDSF